MSWLMPLQTAAHAGLLGHQDRPAHQPPLPRPQRLPPPVPSDLCPRPAGDDWPCALGSRADPRPRRARALPAHVAGLCLPGATRCAALPAGASLPLNKGPRPHSPPALCRQLPSPVSPPARDVTTHLDEASVALTPGPLLTLERPSLTPLAPLPHPPLFPSPPQAIPLEPRAKGPRSSD